MGKKNIKQSKNLTNEQNKPILQLENPNIIKVYSANGTVVEIPHDAEVQVMKSIDDILDLLSDFPADAKSFILKTFDEHEKTDSDKAIFLRVEDKNITYYVIITKIVTSDEDKGLHLMYSSNINLISLYVEHLTSIEYERAKEAFEAEGKSFEK